MRVVEGKAPSGAIHIWVAISYPETEWLRLGELPKTLSALSSRGQLQRTGGEMSLYFFLIRNGRYSGGSDSMEFADQDAARVEMTQVCGDLVGSVCRNLKESADWNMELLDETKKPLFRVRLVAEALD